VLQNNKRQPVNPKMGANRLNKGNPLAQGIRLLAGGAAGSYDDMVYGYRAGTVASGQWYESYHLRNSAIDPLLGSIDAFRTASVFSGIMWGKESWGSVTTQDPQGRHQRVPSDITLLFRGFIAGWGTSNSKVIGMPSSNLGTWPNPYMAYQLQRNDSGNGALFHIATGSSSSDTITTTSTSFWDQSSTDYFHTYVVTRQGGTVRFYRDIEDSNDPSAVRTWASGGTQIGNIEYEEQTGFSTNNIWYNSSDNWIGNVAVTTLNRSTGSWAEYTAGGHSLVGVWDRALAPEEVVELHNRPQQLWTPPTKLWWLDEAGDAPANTRRYGLPIMGVG